MTVVDLLETLRRLKVSVRANGDKLVIDAPAGVIDETLAGNIRANKYQLLELIRSAGQGEDSSKVELARAPDEDRLSLTQERVWAIHQLDPESSQFNLPGAWWLDGPLDTGALRQAIAAFESHHEIFRRRFVSKDGSPRVSPPEHDGVAFSMTTLGEIGLEAEDTHRLARWFEDISASPFDLAADALLRVVLLRVSETRHLLSVISHSIVWDAWCYDIFLAELGRNYEALLAGEPLAGPDHQYSDFVHWQRADQDRRAAREALQAAIDRLEGHRQRLVLPRTRQSVDPREHSGARFNFDIPVELREALRAFCRQQGVTPFMVFLSSYAYLLCRYAGKGSALITVPLRGRERPEFETIPGPFTKNLFLPVEVEDRSFASLLASVKQETGQAFGGEVPSFERLIEAINQNLADSAFFQLQFSYQNVENRGTEWARGIRMSAGPAHDSDHVHAEISFWMREGRNSMDGAIDYRTSLFDEAFIARFYERLLAVIRAGIATPDAALLDLDIEAPGATTDAPTPPTRIDTLSALKSELAQSPERTVLATPTDERSAGQLLAMLDDAAPAAINGASDAETTLVRALVALAAGREPMTGAPIGAIDIAVAAWRERFPEGCARVLVALPNHAAACVTTCLAVLAAGRQLCLPATAEMADERSLSQWIEQTKPDLVLLASPAMEALLETETLPSEPRYLVWALPGASRLKDSIAAQSLEVRYLLATEATLGIGLVGTGEGWPLAFERQENGVAIQVRDPAGREQLDGLDGGLVMTLQEAPTPAQDRSLTIRRRHDGTLGWPDSDPIEAPETGAVLAGLLALESVRDAHVEVRRTNPAAPTLVAWVEQALRREASTTELRQALREQAIRPPEIIIDVDRILRDRNGAVIRQELAHPDEIPAHSRFEPPATEREIAFAGLWKDVLSIDRVSANDTFANLGGTSVQALVILSETQKRLGCSFEPRLLFFQTLRQIADRFPQEASQEAPA